MKCGECPLWEKSYLAYEDGRGLCGIRDLRRCDYVYQDTECNRTSDEIKHHAQNFEKYARMLSSRAAIIRQVAERREAEEGRRDQGRDPSYEAWAGSG